MDEDNPLLVLFRAMQQRFAPAPPTLPAAQAQPLARAPNPQAYFAQQGVMPEQVARFPEVSRRIHAAVDPSVAYPSVIDAAKVGINALLDRPAEPRAVPSLTRPGAKRETEAMQDAFAIYLGIPQKHNNLKISAHKPTNSADKNARYYEFDNVLDLFSTRYGPGEGKARPLVRDIVKAIDKSPEQRFQDNTRVLGKFSWTKGRDERGPYIAYYDKWDFDIPLERRAQGFVGKPFEVYGRVYYDPKTFQPVEPKAQKK